MSEEYKQGYRDGFTDAATAPSAHEDGSVWSKVIPLTEADQKQMIRSERVEKRSQALGYIGVFVFSLVCVIGLIVSLINWWHTGSQFSWPSWPTRPR